MELDPLPPSLYQPGEEDEEDLHRSSAPSEDIWKKFELLPPGGPAEEAGGGAPSDYLLEPVGLLGNLSAFVLRDCMWSGFSGRERLEKARADGKPLPAKATATPCAHDAGSLGGECVAPAAVFAWPGLGAAMAPSAVAPAAVTPSAPSADGKFPASSGSESPSDSEGEIDVVTVEKRQSLSMRKPVTITVRADPFDPCMKRFHISIHQQQHNYAARSPTELCPADVSVEKSSPEEDESLPPHGNGVPSPRQAAEGACAERFAEKCGSAPSSDSEDVSKRKNHNYLERKRRNDLRSRFLALRDQVPSLAACPKTPKVVVLSKASEYLQSLLSTEQQMVAEKKLLKLHQFHLLKRISYLKGAH